MIRNTLLKEKMQLDRSLSQTWFPADSEGLKSSCCLTVKQQHLPAARRRLCLAHAAVVKPQHARVLKSCPQKLLLYPLVICTAFKNGFSQQIHFLCFQYEFSANIETTSLAFFIFFFLSRFFLRGKHTFAIFF